MAAQVAYAQFMTDSHCVTVPVLRWDAQGFALIVTETGRQMRCVAMPGFHRIVIPRLSSTGDILEFVSVDMDGNWK